MFDYRCAFQAHLTYHEASNDRRNRYIKVYDRIYWRFNQNFRAAHGRAAKISDARLTSGQASH